MTIEKAAETLRLTKQAVMMAAFNNDLSGIDGAVPQGYADEKGLMYGAEDTAKDLFWLVTDCRRGFIVVDMRALLSEDKKNALITCAIMLDFATRKVVPCEKMARTYSEMEKVIYRKE